MDLLASLYAFKLEKENPKTIGMVKFYKRFMYRSIYDLCCS